MLLRSLKIMRKATADVSNRPTDGDVVAMIKLANSSVSLSALSYLKPQTLQDKALGFVGSLSLLIAFSALHGAIILLKFFSFFIIRHCASFLLIFFDDNLIFCFFAFVMLSC